MARARSSEVAHTYAVRLMQHLVAPPSSLTVRPEGANYQ